MLLSGTTSVICFHDEFYCIGTDKVKVAMGIEDRTEMRQIEPDRMWNPGVCLSTKKLYSDVNSSKEEMIKLNEEVMLYTVVEPGKLKVNLLDPTKTPKVYKEKFQKWKTKTTCVTKDLTHPTLNIKVGETIVFMGGYDDDIEFTSEVLGFDPEGKVYVVWDCYWAPVLPKFIVS